MDIRDLEYMVINGGYDANILFDDGRDAVFSVNIADNEFIVDGGGIAVLNDGGYLLITSFGGDLVVSSDIGSSPLQGRNVFRGGDMERAVEELSSYVSESIMAILDDSGIYYIADEVYKGTFEQIWDQIETDLIFEVTDEYSD